jgi:hypothetical protein
VIPLIYYWDAFYEKEKVKARNMAFNWNKSREQKNLPLTGPILQAKAQFLAEFLNLPSLGRSRFDIRDKKFVGESASADSGKVQDGKQLVAETIKKFGLEHVYNADETGVFFRLPSNTLCVGNETPAGKKKAKERIIILFCASAAGKKVKPWYREIGPAKPSTEFVYRNNKKAWMTNLLFLEYSRDLDRTMTCPTADIT